MIPIGKFLLSFYSERGEANFIVFSSRHQHLGHFFFAVIVRVFVSILFSDNSTSVSFTHYL